MTEKVIEIEELEERFRAASARHGERAKALEILEERLAEFPARVADAKSAKDRGKLAAEYSKLEADHKLLALEVEELARRRESAYEAIFLERLRAAEAELRKFERETLFPAKRAADELGKQVRAALNNRGDRDREQLSLEEIEKLKIAKAQAESTLRLAAAKRRDLRGICEHRRNEIVEYRRERDG